MLDDRMNAAAPFDPSEVQRKAEGRPHECHAENSDQCRRAGKAGGGQSETVTFLTEQIVSWCRDILETEQRREMRTVTHGINCALEDDTWSRSFNHNDGDGFVRRGASVGLGHNSPNRRCMTSS